MDKLIIENRTDIPLLEIIPYVNYVLEKGKISTTSSGDQYCFATVFESGIIVSAFKNKKSDRLVVYREKGV